MNDVVSVPTTPWIRRWTRKDMPFLRSREDLLVALPQRAARNALLLTWLVRGRLRAQLGLGPRAARLLVTLLACPEGADFALLLASLDASDQLLQRLLWLNGAHEAQALLRDGLIFWQQRLDALHGRALQAERRLVRRALTDRRYGLGPKLEAEGFPLTVRARYGWGYVLAVREPLQG